MIVLPYKTEPVVKGGDLFPILKKFLPPLQEKDIVVVTSKIVSICEGRIRIIKTPEEKQAFVREESEYYIDNEQTRRYGYQLTIANNICIPNSGIDESNGNGYGILWPENPMKSAEGIWQYIKDKYNLHHAGVIITDSHTTMLRKGTSGIGLSWCGFEALQDYAGKPDIFGRLLRVTQANVLDGLSAAAVSVMGEGNEQTPLAVIREAQHVVFTDHPPSDKERTIMSIAMEQDMYAPLLTDIPWKKGGKA